MQKPKRHSFFISSLGAGAGGERGGRAHVAVAVPPSNAIERNGSERYQHLEGRGGEGSRSPPLARARPPPLISPSITVAAENEFNGEEGEAHARARLGHAGSS